MKPPRHEGLLGRWCPICGTCIYPQEHRSDPNCPLHGTASEHGR